MKNIAKALIILFGIIFIKLTFYYLINGLTIINYNHKLYSTTLLKILYPLNINERYIVYYNEGNILYRKDSFTDAISKYDEAINANPPEKRICEIRINKSIAMVRLVNKKDSNAYTALERAKENLYEDGCANRYDDNGKSMTAEKLKNEIIKLQESLDDPEEDQDSDSKEDSKKEENKQQESKTIEEKLKEIEKNAQASRNEELNQAEGMGSFDFYHGKKW